MKLTDLDTGLDAKIVKINGENSFQERLCELGISPGAQLNIKSKLPFKGPIVLRVESSTLALRREEAELIEVSK